MLETQMLPRMQDVADIALCGETHGRSHKLGLGIGPPIREVGADVVHGP
jgi:hypothetical protein